MNEFGTVQYTYHCKKCAKNYKWVLTFDEWKNEDYACPECLIKLKYITSCDIREGQNNVNYVSFEKQSEINKKALGKEKLDEMVAGDPLISQRKAQQDLCKQTWWKKYSAFPDRPIKMSEIKNPEKYIKTGRLD